MVAVVAVVAVVVAAVVAVVMEVVEAVAAGRLEASEGSAGAGLVGAMAVGLARSIGVGGRCDPRCLGAAKRNGASASTHAAVANSFPLRRCSALASFAPSPARSPSAPSPTPASAPPPPPPPPAPSKPPASASSFAGAAAAAAAAAARISVFAHATAHARTFSNGQCCSVSRMKARRTAGEGCACRRWVVSVCACSRRGGDGVVAVRRERVWRWVWKVVGWAGLGAVGWESAERPRKRRASRRGGVGGGEVGARNLVRRWACVGKVEMGGGEGVLVVVVVVLVAVAEANVKAE